MQKNNLIFELVPLLVFFTVYYITKNLFMATGICILFTWVSIIIYKIMYKHVTKNMLLSAALLTIFGGFSILFHNKTLVMIKPTVLYWILAISLLTSQLLGKNLIELSLKKELSLSQKSWSILNIMWFFFFIVLGVINLMVAFYFDESVWVKFKVFGTMLFMLLFMIITVIYVFKQQKNYSKL